MAYQDFLSEFAAAQNVASVDVLLNDHAEQYSFQIRSRDRAKMFIAQLERVLEFDFEGRRVLDIGCAYGSFSIELAHLGAHVTGIDVSKKWLNLAKANAKNEADVQFVLADASSRDTLEAIADEPYDLIVLSDVFEHIYDTAGLLHNCRSLLADGGLIYFKVPNGLATESVLSEGHKKVFGISLLAPDYWQLFVSAPFSIYYRRWEYFEALFDRFGFELTTWLTHVDDANINATAKRILQHKQQIDNQLSRQTFANPQQKASLTEAIGRYFQELEADMDQLDHRELYLKYCATFWEGVLRKGAAVENYNRHLPKASLARRTQKSVRRFIAAAARDARRLLGR